MPNTITITLKELVTHQKALGTFVPELFPPFKNPTQKSIAQTYWLAQVLEEVDEALESERIGDYSDMVEELADVVIFLQCLAFTTTEEQTFTLEAKGPTITNHQYYERELRDICTSRKTWKSYPSSEKDLASWLRYLLSGFKVNLWDVAYMVEAKRVKNLKRLDWVRSPAKDPWETHYSR